MKETTATKQSHKQAVHSPLEGASLFSVLYYSWVLPIITLGYQRPLEHADVPAVPNNSAAKIVGDRLERSWNKQLRNSQDDSHKALMWALWDAFGTQYIVAGIPRFFFSVFAMIEPLLAGMLIEYVKDKSAPVWRGVLLIVAVLVTSLLRFSCGQFHWWKLEYVSMEVKASLSRLVYQKSLRVASISQGNASNLLNVDPSKVAAMCWHLHSFWDLPLDILLGTIVLYQFLGWTSFVALGIMCLMAPLNKWTLGKLDDCENKIMKLKDSRVKSLTEVLQGILVVKLFAWEDKMKERVGDIRAKEIVQLKIFSYFLAAFNFFITVFANVIAVFTLSVYVLVGNTIDAGIIFPSLVVFNRLTFPVLLVPQITSRLAEAMISIKRLNTFFRREELKIEDRFKAKDASIRITNSDFVYYEHDKDILPDEEIEEEDDDNDQDKGNKLQVSDTIERPNFSLSNINFQAKKGELVAIIGRVGSGKSSLLRAILNELRQKKGDMEINGTICLAAQQPWIRNATLKDNILFGNSFNKERYQKALKACALLPDLDILAAGDKTEIGEKGVNLSGGQKQRVSLARALFADNDIYLLDDPLSAVDSHVGQHIFNKCILKALKNKTRILVTHQLQYLPNVDRIYVFEQGKIQQAGTYKELLESGYDFAQLLKDMTAENVLSLSDSLEVTRSDGKGNSSNSSSSSSSLLSQSQFISRNQLTNSGNVPRTTLTTSGGIPQTPINSSGGISRELAKSTDSVTDNEEIDAKSHIVDEEERVKGAVDLSVYKNYLLNVGTPIILGIMGFAVLLMQLSDTVTQAWLSVWSDGKIKPDPGLWFYLGVYLGICCFNSVISAIYQFMWFSSTLNCAKKLHEKLLGSILRAPPSFFHAQPSGRIINRFSKDQGSIDQSIPDTFSDCIGCIVASIVLAVTTCAVIPFMLLAFAPVVIVYYFIQKYYRATARELSRLNSITSSPIFAQYSETIQGLETIRAYKSEENLKTQNETLIDTNNGPYFLSFSVARWLGVRLEILGSLICVAAAVIAVINKNNMTPGEIGLVLSLTTSITGYLNWFIRTASTLESQMNNVERVLHYISTTPEAPPVIKSSRPPKNWPNMGKIQFNNLSLKYREDLDLVLKKLSFTINPKEKIGVVGRTGAGKSSLTNALFRLVEPCSGTIIIDTVDTSTIGLQDLRSNLSIIPQDPFMFSGTVRNNLDPFGAYEDNKIWEVLERVHMKDYISKLSKKLDAKITENGSNLSVGQRQLMCIGRALLRNSKVLIMDEATASVDNETDGLIQKTVRTEFADKTVITIAHRLNTIMDSDRVMVMEKGEIAEFGKPRDLLEDPAGMFSKLVQNTGEKSAEYLRKIAFGEVSVLDSDAPPTKQPLLLLPEPHTQTQSQPPQPQNLIQLQQGEGTQSLL